MSIANWRDKVVDFNTLQGKTLVSIERITGDDDMLVFTTQDGEVIYQYHEQDCCEGVTIDDIVGDLGDLIGHPLLKAEETSNSGETDWGSETWTFYDLATIKGSVQIRWYGSSKGYYSESVSCKLAGSDRYAKN